MPPMKVICLSDNLAPFGEGYWAEHGLSFYVESGDVKVLFDTGQSGDVMLHNARLAGVSLGGLDYIVISHGHYDHAGGLMKALEMSEGVPVIMHPAALGRKIAGRSRGLKDISLPFRPGELRKRCELRIEPGPVDLGCGISTTGEIRRIAPFESPQPDLLEDKNGELSVDPVMDDQSLVLRTDGGIVLLCGCCHAGIVNTIEGVKHLHGTYPGTIAGGLHLEKASPERLSHTVEALMRAGVKKIVAGHCSGDGTVPRLCSAGIEARRLSAGMPIEQ